jgi:hypothetical protein
MSEALKNSDNPEPVSTVAEFPRDRLNRAFDPAKFRSNPDGSPFLNVRDEFMPKGGRKAKEPTAPKPGETGSAPTVEKPATEPPSGERPPPEFEDIEKLMSERSGADGLPKTSPTGQPVPANVDKYTLAAIGTVGGISTAAIMMMGKHVKPSADESAAMVEAYADCYRHYGYAPETPPWLGPVIATAAWVGPHLSDPKSQTRLQKFKAKITGLLMKIRGRRDATAATTAAKEAAETNDEKA